MQQFQIALQSIRSHKTRAALTVLEIVIGIAAVIIVLSAGEGIRGVVVGQLETFGNNVINVEIKIPSTAHVSTENAAGMAEGVAITTLKISDAEALKKEIPNINDYYGAVMDQRLVTFEGTLKKAIIFGASSAVSTIDKTKVVEGRFYTKEENDSMEQLAVLGPTVRDVFFGESDAVGKTIKIGKDNFKVIGVLEKRGAVFGMDLDNQIYIPLKTLQKRLMGIDYITFSLVQVKDESKIDETVEEIEIVMRRLHNISDPDRDDFAVTSMAEARSIMDNVITGLEILLLVLVAISLVVGGVGIMNVVYVSVVERTPEIGLRKAVGARDHDILWQFLWESILVSLMGGVIGTVLGVAVSYGLTQVALSQGFKWVFAVPFKAYVISFGFSLIVGVVFGVFPARLAAKMDPIRALRHE